MSVYADEGSAAHQVLEECLRMIYQIGIPAAAADYVGNFRRIEDGPHGRLSPSGAKRWMTCPGSPAMEAMFPETPDGPRDVEVTSEMAEAVQQALDYVEMRCTELQDLYGPEAEIEVIPERRVSPRDVLGTSDCDGTSDITITGMVEGKVVFIEQADYKHGAGVPVSVDDPQNDFYLLGSCCAVNDDDAVLKAARCTIIQPRCDKVDPRIRWRDISDFDEWWEGFVDRAESALNAVVKADRADELQDPDNPFGTEHLFASEDGCRFCNAKGACSEYTRFALAQVGVVDTDAPLPEGDALYQDAEDFATKDHRLLTPEQLVALLETKDILVGALQAAEAYAQRMLEDDTAPQMLRNRYKLVAKQTRRSWGVKDPVELERRLKRLKGIDPKTGKLRGLGKKDLYVTKLDSVAGVERSLKALMAEKIVFQAFRELVYKPDGSPVIAPVSDPREALDMTPVRPEDAFADAPTSAPPTPDEEKKL